VPLSLPVSNTNTNTDDYISAEILEGHALMIDRPAFGRGAVRKYWLAQDFIRSIAMDAIENVEFAAGDPPRRARSSPGNRAQKSMSIEAKATGSSPANVCFNTAASQSTAP